MFDNTQILLEGDVTGTGNVVPLTGLKIPGKMNPIPMCLKITKAITGLTAETLDIKLQQSDDGKTGWTDVPNSTISIAKADVGNVGRIKSVKYLPREVTKSFIKAVVTATGATAGEVFMALTREDEEPMEAGLYIDKGVVEG